MEQSPILPSERAGSIEHNEYLNKVLQTGFIGELSDLDDERRAHLEEWLADDDILARQAHYELSQERQDAHIAISEIPAKAFEELFCGDLPPYTNIASTTR